MNTDAIDLLQPRPRRAIVVRHREAVSTVREATAALAAWPPVTLDIACSQLDIRSFLDLQPGTLLEPHESERMGRLLTLLDAATDGTGEGYIGVLWTMGRCSVLGGQTPIEACRSEARSHHAMAALKREQDRLFSV